MLEGFVISKLRPQRVLGIFSDPKQHDEENDSRSDLCEFQLRYLKKYQPEVGIFYDNVERMNQYFTFE